MSEPNPYEAPITAASRNEPGTGKTAVDMRVAGGVLWIIAIVPHVLVIDGIVRQKALKHTDLSDPITAIGLSGFYCTFCLLPLVGCGLLGLACWWRSWRTAYMGGLVLAVAVVAGCGLVLFAP